MNRELLLVNMESDRKHLRRIINENLHSLRSRMNGRPLTVALIGTVGVGKSSLINSISAAMSSSKWREFAYTGGHAYAVESVTTYTARYPQCCRPEEFGDPLLPTLLDIGGFTDEVEDIWEKVMNMIFYGKVPENENPTNVYNYFKNAWDYHEPKYTRTDNRLKVDRVLVVCSAKEELPENLLKMVVRAARPKTSTSTSTSTRSIPIFGVMTKVDLVDPEVDRAFDEKEQKFKEILGLHGSETRYKRLSNYCGAIDPNNDRIKTYFPRLDVPILELMTQICDPALEVVKAYQDYPWWPVFGGSDVFLTIILIGAFLLLIALSKV